MPHEFRMPTLGADMEEGTFIEWLVKPGQAVSRGDIVCVIETQKGAVDVEIWEGGTVASLVAQPGQKIPVGQVMALIAQPGDAPVSPAASAAPPPVATTAVSPAMVKAAPLVVAEAAAATTEPAAAVSAAREAPQVAPSPSAARWAAPSATRARVSPAARRRAAELGIDLDTVTSAGADGVVSLADVERAASSRVAAPVAASAAAHAAAPPAADRQAAMRAAIGAAMERANRDIPHYYLATEFSVEPALGWLEQFNAARPITGRVLFAALQLKAVALALREAPSMNGWFVDHAFRAASAIHPGVAISLRGGGLVAPALHDADRLGLADLMAALRDLLGRARNGQLRSSELTDATITVTNLGDIGVETVYGVIYPPQVALVGFGRVSQRPWVNDGVVVPARTLTTTLAADHRASDGMAGARFLTGVRELLEHPESLC